MFILTIFLFFILEFTESGIRIITFIHFFISESVLFIIQSVNNLFDLKIHISDGQLYFNENVTALVLPTSAYPFFIVLSMFAIVIPFRKLYSLIIYFVSVYFFIVLRAVIVTFIYLFLFYTKHRVLLYVIDPLIYMPAFFWVLYVIKSNSNLLAILNRFNSSLSNISYLNIQKVVLLFIVIPPLPVTIFTYSGNSLEWIISIILRGSQLFVSFLGLETTVAGNRILLGSNWIGLGLPCIGLGVMSTVAILMGIMKGLFVNKLLWFSLFAFVFQIVNSIRLGAALFYLNQYYTLNYISLKVLHDIITYIMYLVAFVFVFLYIIKIHRNG